MRSAWLLLVKQDALISCLVLKNASFPGPTLYPDPARMLIKQRAHNQSLYEEDQTGTFSELKGLFLIHPYKSSRALLCLTLLRLSSIPFLVSCILHAKSEMNYERNERMQRQPFNEKSSPIRAAVDLLPV